MKWIHKGKSFKIKDLEKYWGFVYKITNIETGEFYIGSKQFWSRTNPKISKKRSNELYSGKGRKKIREAKIKESDWMNYSSSSKKVQEVLIQNPNIFKFEVLELFETKSEMLLTEAVMIGKEFLKRNALILNDWLSVRCQKLK